MATSPVSPSKRSANGVVSITAQQMRGAAPAPPLDYSFMGLATLSDMLQNDPVSGKKKTGTGTGTGATTAADDDSAGGSSKAAKTAASAVSLRASNNQLENLDDMDAALAGVFDDPTLVQWLDLSGNALTSIPPKAFAKYGDMHTLHLHGNLLAKFSDIDHLAACLPQLRSLALHGNPLEEKKHYRSYVISSFPHLKQLDFSSVTNGDRDKATTWAKIYKKAMQGSRRKRRHGDDSDLE